MAFLLDGKALALKLKEELKAKIAQLPFTPTLGVILVGDDHASHLYVNLKVRAAAEVGIAVEKVLLPKDADFTTVVSELKKFNEAKNVHAILVQLPLPPQLDEHKIIELMDPAKDADGFHPQNLKRFLSGESAITPGLSSGIVKLIELAGKPLQDTRAALVVNSQKFAQPLIKLLNERMVQCSILTKIEPDILKTSDIIVVATGRPGTITSEHIKDGAIVIDVGTTKVGTKVVGDVDADSLTNRSVYLTPVPGGVGPMTVVMLLWNVCELSCHTANS